MLGQSTRFVIGNGCDVYFETTKNDSRLEIDGGICLNSVHSEQKLGQSAVAFAEWQELCRMAASPRRGTRNQCRTR